MSMHATAPAAAPAIEVRGLSHAFKGHQALAGIDFAVASGSLHGFVGPNGAGKTTTLKVLATLLRPDGGRVRVFDVDALAQPDRVRPRIGFMPDHFSLYRQMTVHEYLDFFAAAYGLPHKQRSAVIDDVLALTDMAGRRDDQIKGLSRGMQQRVSLARVLVHDPDLLLLDEPASGLDPRARIELMEILRELRGMGKTVFISSHILTELADLCDSVTILDRGQVRYSGSMHGLLTRQGEEGAYVLTLAEPCEGFEEALRGQAGVVSVSGDEQGRRFVVVFDRAGCLPADLLTLALARRAQVVDFREEIKHLNQAFLDLTTAGVRS